MPSQGFDVELAREQFPILHRPVRGRPLVYLDNAATAQKPLVVLDAMDRFYREDNGSVHRGLHTLSARATAAYEGARQEVQRFLGAADPREIVFVRGATEAINLVAHTFGRERVAAGDEILVTAMEHHSNLVPWHLLCRERQARLRVVPVTPDGELDLAELEHLLGPRTRLLCVTHVSNALGTVNPIGAITSRARSAGVPVLVDGAQSAPHLPIDVRELGCDFFVFSGHKAYGPTGIGALYGRWELLSTLPPYQGGGEMIESVSFEEVTFAAAPARFEAGTPNAAGAVGLAAALRFLRSLPREAVAAHERALIDHARRRLEAVPGVRLVGRPAAQVGALSFTMEGVHPHDLATILDGEGIAIRAGHHCAEPLIRGLGLAATARASFALYNTRAEVDLFADAVEKVGRFFTA